MNIMTVNAKMYRIEYTLSLSHSNTHSLTQVHTLT